MQKLVFQCLFIFSVIFYVGCQHSLNRDVAQDKSSSERIIDNELLASILVPPSVVRRNSSTHLAKLIVSRLAKNQNIDLSKVDSASLAAPEIIMMAPQKFIKSFIRFGFLNQHQTINSIVLNQYRRIKVEQNNAQSIFPYAQKILEVFPKYGVLNIKGESLGGDVLPVIYGELAVVFKKSVLERTTFSNTDSLVEPQLLKPALNLIQNTKNLKCKGFCEAQIWGPLSINDVSHFMLYKGHEPSQELIDLGLPIYTFDHKIRNDQTSMYESKLLVEGKNPNPLPPAPALSSDDIATLIRKETNSTINNILVGQFIRAQTDSTLVEWITKEIKQKNKKKKGDSVLVPLHRYVGELSVRPPTDLQIETLLNLLKHPDEYVQTLALIGLSELPPEELAPILAAAVKKSFLQMTVAAIAAEHLNNLEIKKIFCAMKSPWISILQSQYCENVD